MGVLLEHVHLMDSKVQEMCTAIQAMGGDVCSDNLPKMNLDDFEATGMQPVIPDNHEDFDPKI